MLEGWFLTVTSCLVPSLPAKQVRRVRPEQGGGSASCHLDCSAAEWRDLLWDGRHLDTRTQSHRQVARDIALDTAA